MTVSSPYMSKCLGLVHQRFLKFRLVLCVLAPSMSRQCLWGNANRLGGGDLLRRATVCCDPSDLFLLAGGPIHRYINQESRDVGRFPVGYFAVHQCSKVIGHNVATQRQSSAYQCQVSTRTHTIGLALKITRTTTSRVWRSEDTVSAQPPTKRGRTTFLKLP